MWIDKSGDGVGVKSGGVDVCGRSGNWNWIIAVGGNRCRCRCYYVW